MDQSGCRNEIMNMHEKRFQSLSNPPIIKHNEQCLVTDSQSRLIVIVHVAVQYIE